MWIKTKDREPTDGGEVLVAEPPIEGVPLFWIGEFNGEMGGFNIVGGGFLGSGDVSYWMEIPPPPKEK